MGEIKNGLVMYDVPQTERHLATLMRTRIRRFALRVNNSVYVFPWENRELVAGVVEEIHEKTGKVCAARILAQAAEADAEIKVMVVEAGNLLLGNLHKGLQARLSKIPARLDSLIVSGKMSPNERTKHQLRDRKSVV